MVKCPHMAGLNDFLVLMFSMQQMKDLFLKNLRMLTSRMVNLFKIYGQFFRRTWFKLFHYLLSPKQQTNVCSPLKNHMVKVFE